MKIVYNNPTLALTGEEMGILNRASEILASICGEVDNYGNCKSECPIYEYCPYHQSFIMKGNGRIHNLLDNIVFEAEGEDE